MLQGFQRIAFNFYVRPSLLEALQVESIKELKDLKLKEVTLLEAFKVSAKMGRGWQAN